MALRGFIGSHELDLPKDFKLPIEIHSPIYDFNDFRIGDISISIKFPLTSRNRLAFEFADELEIAKKTLTYDNFRLEEDGEFLFQGVLKLEQIVKETPTSGYYDCDYYTNLLPDQAQNKSIIELLQGQTVNLGSTTAAIIAAAKAQNEAAMSTDGSTGAVMKFVPHFNPEFYGNENPDWYPRASDWRTANFQKDDHAVFQPFENAAFRGNGTDFAFVGEKNFTLGTSSGVTIPFDETSSPYVQGPFFVGVGYECPEDGNYTFRIVLIVKNRTTSNQGFFMRLRNVSQPGSGNLDTVSRTLGSGEELAVALTAVTDALLDDVIGVEASADNANAVEVLIGYFDGKLSDKSYAYPEVLFRAISDINSKIEPGNEPAWLPASRGVLNAWDNLSNQFLTNGSHDPFAPLEINRHTLAPWLTTHTVIRKLAEAIGYSVKGTYMNDAHEQRALLCSNFAIDMNSGWPSLARIGLVDHAVSSSTTVALPFAITDGIYDNQAGLYNTNDHRYEVDQSGWHKIKVRIKWRRGTSGGNVGWSVFLKDDLTASPLQGPFVTDKIPDDQVNVFETTIYHDPASGDHLFITSEAGANQIVIIDASLEIYNIETDFVNQYDGTVKISDLVPDESFMDFFKILGLTKALFIDVNYTNKEITIDYQRDVYKGIACSEMSDFVTGSSRIEQKPPKRYALNYGELPDDVFEPDGTEADPVSTASELEKPNIQNIHTLVRNENAWYSVRKHNSLPLLVWKRSGSNYPDLRLQEEGDLIEIKPKAGVPAMQRVLTYSRQIALMPRFDAKGRSNMFNSGGSRMPFTEIYWAGYDSTLTGGYPLATTTKFNNAGTAVFTRDMTWQSIYQLNWKRTLECLVLEEITRNYFRFPPEKKQLINFARIFLLGHVPVIPIKTAEVAGGNGLMEIEARKVKSVAVKVVGAVAEEEPVVALWQPSDGEVLPLNWWDASDISTITTSGNELTGWQDKGTQQNDLSPPGPDNRPSLSLLNGNTSILFDGTSDYLVSAANAGITGSGARHTFIVYKNNNEVGRRTIFSWGTSGTSRSYAFETNGYNGPARNMYMFAFNRDVYTSAQFELADTALLDVQYNAGQNHLQGTIMRFYGETVVIQLGSDANGVLDTHSGPYNMGREAALSRHYFEGEIAEVLVYNEVLDQELRQKIQGYLAHQWGNNAQLDPSHPYFINAPTI